MKIVLRTDVPNVGDTGEVVTVAGGYARNFLIPRGLAVPATKGNIAHAETWKQSRSARVQKETGAAEETRRRLESAPVEVGAQTGPDGRLFGSITAPQVVEAIASKLGVDVDRHDVRLAEPIRHLGFHEVEVRLHPEVTAKVTVEVVESS
jgi:large subunit ribosomal protein L9